MTESELGVACPFCNSLEVGLEPEPAPTYACALCGARWYVPEEPEEPEGPGPFHVPGDDELDMLDDEDLLDLLDLWYPDLP